MIFIWKLDLNVANSNLKKINKERGDESIVRKMQALMSSGPCGTLLNILNILGRGAGMKTVSPNLNQRREPLSSLQIL